MKGGNKNGTAYLYYSSGKLFTIANYVSGKSEGMMRIYNSDGSVMNNSKKIEIEYRDPFKHGEGEMKGSCGPVPISLNLKALPSPAQKNEYAIKGAIGETAVDLHAPLYANSASCAISGTIGAFEVCLRMVYTPKNENNINPYDLQGAGLTPGSRK